MNQNVNRVFAACRLPFADTRRSRSHRRFSVGTLCRLLVATLVFFVTTPELLAQSGKPLFTAPLGIQTYSFRKFIPKDLEGTLDTMKAMGFKEIEGGGTRNVSPEEFRKMCEKRGMKVVSTGAGFEELDRAPDSVAMRAKKLGAKFVMCAWVPHQRGAFNLDDAKKAVEVFNRAGKVLKSQGVTLAYHAHGYELQPYQNGTLLDYIFENTKPEDVSFEMDIMWMHFGGANPAELLRKYGNRWKLMHLKDLKKGTPKDLTGLTDEDNDVALGTGELNIPEILKEAKRVGVQHYFIEDESSNVHNQVRQSIAYLKSLKE